MSQSWKYLDFLPIILFQEKAASVADLQKGNLKTSKKTAAMLGIVRKKKKVEVRSNLTLDTSVSISNNDKAPETSSGSSAVPKTAGLSLLAGYGSASDSSESD